MIEDTHMGRLAIVNGRIVLPNRVAEGSAVVVADGRIAGLAAPGDLGDDVARVDAGGGWITPGLIDIHIHGLLGCTFNEPTGEAFGTITRALARCGVTSVVGTLATASIPDLTACLDFAADWMAAPHAGSQLLGMHLESPYINFAQRGALDPANIRTPDDGSVDALLEHSEPLRIFVLAPELPGALGLVEKLAARGIMPAAGHSMAQDTDVLAAMARGLRHVTHIWSAMASTVREGPWRKPGLLEAALTFDGLTVEMIADNRHLPPTLMKLATKCIEPDRLCVISDATSGALLPDGSTFRMGSMTYEVADGVGMMLDRTSFGGSTTLVNRMVRILTDLVGVPMPQALRMLSLTPARAVGVADRKGSITAGKDADLVIFNDDFEAERVMMGGRWV